METKMLMVTKDGRVWLAPGGIWRMWWWQRRKIAAAVKILHAELTEIRNRPRVTIFDSKCGGIMSAINECGTGASVRNVSADGGIEVVNGRQVSP